MIIISTLVIIKCLLFANQCAGANQISSTRERAILGHSILGQGERESEPSIIEAAAIGGPQGQQAGQGAERKRWAEKKVMVTTSTAT